MSGAISGQPITSLTAAPFVTPKALWNWDTSTNPPSVVTYSNGQVTKTGLLPPDLQAFVGIPLYYYGNPPQPVSSQNLINWIRYAEDWVENTTSLLLVPTWVAAPPARTQAVAQATGLITKNGAQQQLGIDYDLEDTQYDFFFTRAQDEGWMIQQYRYRPLRFNAYQAYGNPDFTAIKNMAYIYPLLSEYFRVPQTWFVEELDFAASRLVPAANVQMLPLFAMELAFMGFAESIPGAIYTQYIAGLTANDYQNRYSFIKELVLCRAAIIALAAIQGNLNMGAIEFATSVDGLMNKTRFSEKGALWGNIQRFKVQMEELLLVARDLTGGPNWITL